MKEVKLSVPKGQEVPAILQYQGKRYGVIKRRCVTVGVLSEVPSGSQPAGMSNLASLDLIEEWHLSVVEVKS